MPIYTTPQLKKYLPLQNHEQWNYLLQNRMDEASGIYLANRKLPFQCKSRIELQIKLQSI